MCLMSNGLCPYSNEKVIYQMTPVQKLKEALLVVDDHKQIALDGPNPSSYMSVIKSIKAIPFINIGQEYSVELRLRTSFVSDRNNASEDYKQMVEGATFMLYNSLYGNLLGQLRKLEFFIDSNRRTDALELLKHLREEYGYKL
jgi:hypothetical protein